MTRLTSCPSRATLYRRSLAGLEGVHAFLECLCRYNRSNRPISDRFSGFFFWVPREEDPDGNGEGLASSAFPVSTFRMSSALDLFTTTLGI